MKKLFSPHLIPYITLVSGILGLIFQSVLLLTGIDRKGLFRTDHWADLAGWVLIGLTLTLLALCALPLEKRPSLSRLFPPSVSGMLGCIAGAVGVAGAAIRLLVGSADSFGMLTGLLGCGCAIGLTAAAYWRLKGQRPSGLVRIALVLFFALHLLCQYRAWRYATQVQEYAMALFASVFLMLGVYQRAALEEKMTSQELYVFFSHAAAFFCFAAIGEDALFFLPMGLWMFFDNCTMCLPSSEAPRQPWEPWVVSRPAPSPSAGQPAQPEE